MSESSNISLGANSSDLVIKFELSHLINVPKELTQPYLNLTLLLATLTLNTCAVVVIAGKEKTGINYLLIADCFGSIVYVALSTSILPWPNLESTTLCTLFLFFLIFLAIFNRLVPVAIATIRYVMVCHPTFSINHGGEKRISAVVRRFISVICVTIAIYSTFKRENILQFLICVRKEEIFR